MEGGAKGLNELRERSGLFRQMAEMKKKIQLVEGERKATFEDCETEKKENRNRIEDLKEEIAKLQESWKALDTPTGLVQRTETAPVDIEVTLKVHDSEKEYRVADLRRRLDRMRYENQARSSAVADLLNTYESLVFENVKMEQKRLSGGQGSRLEQRIRFLENEIHKTNLKCMEGETIRKKYASIVEMLKTEQLGFGKEIDALEAQVSRQDEEVEQLKRTESSALATRNTARERLFEAEMRHVNETKDRERRLLEARRLAEERKSYFATMERHILAAGTSIKEPGHESLSTSDHGASSSITRTSDDANVSPSLMNVRKEEAEGSNLDDNHLMEAFDRMKKAAGVAKVSQVVHRFTNQHETNRHLQEVQSRAEKEIRDLGAVKELLESEWELVKFMGEEESTEQRERIEELEERITDQERRKRSAEQALRERHKVSVGIREGLECILDKLSGAPLGAPISNSASSLAAIDSLELLALVSRQLEKLLSRLEHVDVFSKSLEMREEESFVAAKALGRTREGEGVWQLEENKHNKHDEIDSNNEEEEVPTRNFLKRQANLIVDAKSRSKRGTRSRR